MSIYSHKIGDVAWNLIAVRKCKFPYYDESHLAVANTPEVSEYRAIGVVKDEEIGRARSRKWCTRGDPDRVTPRGSHFKTHSTNQSEIVLRHEIKTVTHFGWRHFAAPAAVQAQDTFSLTSITIPNSVPTGGDVSRRRGGD